MDKASEMVPYFLCKDITVKEWDAIFNAEKL